EGSSGEPVPARQRAGSGSGSSRVFIYVGNAGFGCCRSGIVGASNSSCGLEQFTVDHCSTTHLRTTSACVRVGAVGRVARLQIVVVSQFFTRPNASPRMHEYPIPLNICLAVGIAGVIHESDAVPLNSSINREVIIEGEQKRGGGIRIPGA